MKWFDRLSFRGQLTTSFLGCLLVSAVIIVFCLALNISGVETGNCSYLERLNEQWAIELDSGIASVDEMRFLHLFDDEVMRIVTEKIEEARQDLQVENELYMSRLLNAMCAINSDVLRVTVETASGMVYGNYVEDSEASIETAKRYMLYADKKEKSGMTVTDVYEGEINLIPYSLLTFCYPFYSVSGGACLGKIYIDFNFDAMKERFDAVEKQEGWSSCILNENGIVYVSDPRLERALGEEEQEQLKALGRMESGNGRMKLNSRDCLVHVRYLENLDWYLIQGVQKSSLIWGNMRGVYLLAFWVAVLLCGIMAAGLLMMKKISTPIKEFSQVMSRAATKGKKELDYMECREEYPAEICEIAYGYNAMIDRIHENIIKECDNELNQKKTELQMLQYQINPHFLYNTLNIMSAIARLNEIPYISDISESLSKIFNYNVKGGQIATFGEELDNLQNYIRIQMIRFPDKFEVRYQIQPGIKKCRILKFLLQPLVENAIEHGISEKMEKGMITIQAEWINEETGEIVIWDNGAGMDGEELERLRDMLEKQDSSDAWEEKKKIGIRNVHRRVQNYYGEQYGITLESGKGNGTSVRIKLPLQKSSGEVVQDVKSDGGRR